MLVKFFLIFSKSHQFFELSPLLLGALIRHLAKILSQKRSSYHYTLLKSRYSVYQRSLLSALVHPSRDHQPRPASNKDILFHVEHLNCLGYSVITSTLCRDLGLSLYKYSLTTQPSINYSQIYQNSQSKRLTHYSEEDLIDIPSVRAVLYDPFITEIVSNCFQSKAKLMFFELFKSYPEYSKNATGSQIWHRDRDNFKQIKLFIYCSPVDINSGPHCYVAKSHKELSINDVRLQLPSSKDKLRSINKVYSRFSDDQLSALGSFDLKTFIGDTGFSFLEDTSGLHKGSIPETKERLLFVATWTNSPFHYPDSPSYIHTCQRLIQMNFPQESNA